jgi:Antitoxin VbhA
MNIALPTNAPATRAERSLALESDVAMIRMQGLEPVPKFFSIAERYVAGELTLDQFSAEVDRLSSPEGAAARKRRQGQRTPLISLFRVGPGGPSWTTSKPRHRPGFKPRALEESSIVGSNTTFVGI